MLEKYEEEGIVEAGDNMDAEQIAALDPASLEMAKSIAKALAGCSPEYRQSIYADIANILTDWHNRLNDVI